MTILALLPVGLCTMMGMAAAGGPQQSRHPNNTPEPYLAVLDRAHKAKANDPASVRALIDAIFDAGVFEKMPDSIRERLVRADLARRRGQERGITEADIVSTVNSAASLPGAPKSIKTSIEQVRGFREIARAMVPFIGSEDGIPKPATHEMSPAEAVFVITALATQKFFNPDYKVPPEEWAATFKANKGKAQRNPGGPRVKPSYGLRATKADPETAAILRVLQDDVKDEWSVVTLGIHLFLDQLGLQQ